MLLAKLRRRSRRRSWRRALYTRPARVALIALAAILTLTAGYFYWSWQRALEPGDQTYVVKSGTTLRAFARQLQERGVVLETRSFVWLAYLTGRSRSLKAGEYRFRKGITAAELLDQVAAGRVVEYPFTIIEGWNFRQLLAALKVTPKLAYTLDGLSDRQIMARLGHPGVHPEGRFYPDTYYYSTGISDVFILSRAYDKMEQHLAKEWDDRASDLPLKTPDEALTLASIVEKETARADERGVIAGVFINRLRKGMRLQTDPTVIYGIGPSFDGNIRYRDLRRDTPYNTYTRAGLPPTPIAMPSGEAVRAVLHPADTKALYFVARKDGSHEFSETLEQHNRAVIKYQLNGDASRLRTNNNGRSR